MRNTVNYECKSTIHRKEQTDRKDTYGFKSLIQNKTLIISVRISLNTKTDIQRDIHGFKSLTQNQKFYMNVRASFKNLINTYSHESSD